MGSQRAERRPRLTQFLSLPVMETMQPARKHVEVFSAGTSQCEATVTVVRAVAGHCEVTIHAVMTDAAAARRARELLIVRLPTVVVDGEKLPVDHLGNISEAVLRDAGID